MNSIRSTWAARRYFKRLVKQAAWSLSKGSPAEFRTGENTCGVLLSEFSCPIVNHPTQQALLQNKLHNMRLAVERINRITIPPQGWFSFWKVVGNPSKRNGFVSGPTFVAGQVMETLGGGLCQVSGLLFNLALLGGLRILERHPHSLDAYGDRRYLALGRDATVAFRTKDLAFQNPYDYEIVFHLSLEPSRASGKLLGDSKTETTVEISAEELIEENGFRIAEITRKLHKKSGVVEEESWKDRYRIPC